MAKFPLKYIEPFLNFVKMSYEDVPESSPTHCWNWECEAGQLSTTICHCITIFQVSLASFAVTTLSTASQANLFSSKNLEWLTWRNNAFALHSASNSGKLSLNTGNTQNSFQSQRNGENTDFFFRSFLHSQRNWLKIVSVQVISPQAAHTKTQRKSAMSSTLTNEGPFQKLLVSQVSHMVNVSKF